MNLRSRKEERVMSAAKIARHVIAEVEMMRCIAPEEVKLKGLKGC